MEAQEFISILTGIISPAIAVAAFYYARKKDTHESSAQITEMIVNLRTMTRDIGDLKTDVAAMRMEWKEDHDTLVGIVNEMKAMWKIIDRLQSLENEKKD